MTRLSKREIARTLERHAPQDTPDLTIVMRDTVVGTSWEDSDMQPGETRDEITEFEL